MPSAGAIGKDVRRRNRRVASETRRKRRGARGGGLMRHQQGKSESEMPRTKSQSRFLVLGIWFLVLGISFLGTAQAGDDKKSDSPRTVRVGIIASFYRDQPEENVKTTIESFKELMLAQTGFLGDP